MSKSICFEGSHGNLNLLDLGSARLLELELSDALEKLTFKIGLV